MDYLYYEVTRRCNQRCVQCFNNSRDVLRDELDTEAARAVLMGFKEQGGKRLQMTGGEALTRRDILPLFDTIAALEFDHVVLSTNGMLFKDDIADRLAPIIDEVDISLDGFGNVHDIMRGVRSHQLALDAIARATSRSIRTYVCCCVTAETYPRLEELIELLISMGVSHVKFAQVGAVGRRATPASFLDFPEDQDTRFARITMLSAKYSGRITVQQSHTTTVQLADLDRDGLVCDPCGRLYPLIGYLPLYWQVGMASPEWCIDEAKLQEYGLAFDEALRSGIRQIALGKPVNWWTILHDLLVEGAPEKVYAI